MLLLYSRLDAALASKLKSWTIRLEMRWNQVCDLSKGPQPYGHEIWRGSVLVFQRSRHFDSSLNVVATLFTSVGVAQ